MPIGRSSSLTYACTSRSGAAHPNSPCASLTYRSIDVMLAKTRRPMSSGARGVGLHDGFELVGRRTVQDHAVTAERELVADGGDALLRRAFRHRLEPLVGDERGHVLELLRGGGAIDRAVEGRHELVGAEPLERCG